MDFVIANPSKFRHCEPSKFRHYEPKAKQSLEPVNMTRNIKKIASSLAFLAMT